MPARAKKRKLNGASNGSSTPDKHALFTQWAKDRGVTINGVHAAHIPGRGMGLVTTKRLAAGEQLLVIPGKAMCKPDPAFLKRENLMSSSPHAQLAISAMYAFQPENSEFRVWQATWPTREDLEQSLPLCWPASLVELLPPSVRPPLERVVADFERDWVAMEKTCVKHGWSREEFRYYWMIVNSRSFHWCSHRKKPGGMVMCPFVDYTNHAPSGSGCNVFQSPQGYEVVADRDYKPNTELFFTYGSHSNDKLLVHYGFILDNSSASPQTNKSLKRTREDATDHPANPWTNLNTDDDIRLDSLILPHLTSETQLALRDLGYLGGYALLPNPPRTTYDGSTTTEPKGNDQNPEERPEICFKTQIAVRAALHATYNEWEYFACSGGEDLGEDRAPQVRSFVSNLLIQLRETGRNVLSTLDDLEENHHRRRGNHVLNGDGVEDEETSSSTSEDEGENAVARSLIAARWKQILQAIDRYNNTSLPTTAAGDDSD